MKKKTKSIEARDRLSELPDSLILKIFEFMPTRDVVRTPILSSRWKNLWTISPYLCFHAIRDDDDDNDDDGNDDDGNDDDDNDDENNDELRRFVNRALLRWRGARVQQFKVSGAILDSSISTEIDLWLRFAVDNRVEVLDISFACLSVGSDLDDCYCPPQYLYSCSSLQKLSLNFCSLEIKGNVQWSRLKSLKIECLGVVYQQMIEQVLCGSPLLEEFCLTIEYKDEDSELSFRSSSLKKLSICQIPDTDPTLVALRIWTPNLVVLTLSGDPSYTNCLLENVSSLARANLLFDKWTWNDFDRKTLTQILPAIQHVEGLTLSRSCSKALGAMRSNSLLPPFSNVKFLSLYYHSDESENILCLLEIFPKLKTLVVDDGGGYCDSKVKFKPNPSNPFLAELEIVEVTWSAGRRSFVFPFIKILLKHASKLEKLVSRVRRHVASDVMLLASKELLGMRRSSGRAKLVFYEY